MSSRRTSRASKPTDDEIAELVLKLQAMLPLLNQSRNSTEAAAAAAAASTILEETCTYIKSLHREVDSLSERLSQLMDAADIELIRRVVQQ